MDLDNISHQALRTTISKMADIIANKEHIDKRLENDDFELAQETKTVTLMQKFSLNITVEILRLYHEELAKKLKEHGIDI
ncbi:hypothetical protein MX569_13810 [Anoxybacillus kestanbolensis]|uniref:hypothetical protein n=1 Tax=Anoxybacillus kestanbolensis TaxID=227476 RepID=UPI00208DD3AE|nr:hypothetical protein [Anoxybacillus kestanbolensis]MCL9971625.1 hypothetical protein [Anoxybacillus kestanbolensis]